MFDEPIQESIKELTNKLNSSLSTREKPVVVDMDEIFMLTTLDIIGRTMFSRDIKVSFFLSFFLIFVYLFTFLVFFI